MLPVYYRQEYLRMEDDLEQIALNNPEPLKRLTTALKCIRQCLAALAQRVNQYPFKDKKEEITFFKEIKPSFYGHYLFEMALYNLAIAAPVADPDQLRSYYLDELRYIQRVLREHTFLYQYYRLGADDLDELYFVRGVEVQSVLIPEVPELDKAFSTSGDYLFSKFRACESLQEYIAHELANIGKPGRAPFVRPGKMSEPLKWTGEQVNAIEVGYGLWLSGQLNEGNASLADIMYWLSQSLDIDLSRHTRRFDEIKGRKLVSQTRFIDQMRDSVRTHIDDSNGLNPNELRRARRMGSKTGD